MRWTILLCLAVNVPGCGLRYHGAMYGAARAAKHENWDGALARYEKAREARPQSETAELRYLETREVAVTMGLEAARVWLETGAYENALERLAYVDGIDPDVADVLVLRQQVEAALVADVQGAWGRGEPDIAYAGAVRLRTLFPSAEPVDRFFDTLRNHYATTAREQVAAKEFEAALATIDTVRRHEPEQEVALVLPLEEVIRGAWADDLVRQARLDDRSGRDGAACLQYARAYELAERDQDRVAAQRLGEQLRREGLLTVSVKVTGNRTRAAALKKQITTAIESVPEATITWSRADLSIYLSAPAPRCSERVVSTRVERPYVSGQVDVENPEHVRIAGELAVVDADRERAHARAMILWGRVEALEDRVKELDADIAREQAAAAAARKRQAEAEQHIAAAVRLRDERGAALDSLTGQNLAEKRAKVEEELVNLAKNISDWQEVFTVVDRDAVKAERRTEMLGSERKPVAADLERVRAEYTGIMAERDAHQATRTKLATKLGITPRTIRRDVPATFAFDEKVWTRECSAATWVAMRTRWDSPRSGEQRYAPVRESVDTAHVGHAPSKLLADAKAYADSDGAMVADADAETGKALAEWVTALGDDHHRDAIDRVLTAVAEDPRTATNLVVALYLASPARLSPEEAELMRSHVASYGVEDLAAVLGGGAVASSR